MSHLLRRLARLLGQSRIRLERRPLEPHDLSPGDWLQVLGRVYRVASASSRDEPACIGLEGIDRPAARARLVTHDTTAGWILLEEGLSLPVPVDAILVYPAGQAAGQ